MRSYSPSVSEIRRPARFIRAYRGVPGSATSGPIMAFGTAAAVMKSIWHWKMSAASLSKPMMNPP